MKRSEMIELMWNFIKEVECDYDYYMEESDVEELLTKMELSGMLPPIIQINGGEYVPYWGAEEK